MPVEILKRPQALRDIEECFVYIAEDNLEIGVCFIAAVEDSLQQISQFPFIGKERVFKNTHFQSVRMWHVKNFENYLIFYLVTDGTVEIIRVLYSSRDIEEIFI
jgi:toxin ParE1/3/4